jgi:serine/threonine-protein kinase
MDLHRWARVEEIFHTASELSPPARATYLHQACAGDADLRAEVQALLDSADEPDLLLRAVTHEASQLLESTSTEGRAIGPYRVVRRLGQGGMGAVYLAIRADDQYEKQVAIKLIRAGHEQRAGLLRRFLNERQILANLEHPHIARLLDGGVTAEGNPYLVMEFVDGQPIDTYARERSLSIDQRLRLFLAVCDAVSYAHRHMIIHRDLKPANILVNAEGTVKLLDFGIAKIARSSPESPANTLTSPLERMLTPDYASPEMLRGDGITTLADIYCLGVILYELLALARPFHIATQSLFEAERAIMTSRPPRPSSVAGSLLQHAGRDRRLDLDAIIDKAMAQDPADRYGSVQDLATDIQAVLGAFPVRARQGSRRYLIRKFISRHRLAVAASAIFALTVIGFAIGMALLASRASRERDLAQLERARAESVSSFLVSMFASADPRQARGETVTARDLLDRGMAQINSDLKQQPAVQVRLLSTIGEAYQFLGLLQEAESAYQRQLQVEQTIHGASSPEVIAALRQLADIRRMRGNYAQARQDLQQVLAAQRATAGPDAAELAQIQNNLALIEQAMGNLTDAVKLFQDAVRIINLYPKEAADALIMRSNLGAALQETGDPRKAESEMRAVLDLRTRSLGATHPHSIRSMLRLGRVLLRNGAYSDASRLVEEALPLSIKVLGPNHSDTLLLRVLQADIDYEFHPGPRLAAVLDDAIRQGSATLGAHHPDVLRWVVHRAEVSPQPTAQDAHLCRATLAELESRLGSRSPSHARGLESCSSLLLRRGDAASALLLARSAADVRRAIQPATHPDLAIAVGLAAQAELALGHAARAESLLREALQIDRASLLRPHFQTTGHLALLATLLQRHGRPEEGQALLREAQTLREEILTKANPAKIIAHVDGSGTSEATAPVISKAQSPVR